MKKIMIALTAIVVGVVARAATVDWSMTVTASAVNYNASNYSVYLVDAAKWDALALVTADTFSDTELVYGHTTFAAGTGKSATSKSYATLDVAGNKSAYSTTLSDSIVAAGNTLDVYYVILDTSKNPSEYYASRATLTAREATGTQVQTGFASVANSSISWTATSSTVPEPTSGLLMLLGLAGLSLRRKHA